jgi:hypothetical protein
VAVPPTTGTSTPSAVRRAGPVTVSVSATAAPYARQGLGRMGTPTWAAGSNLGS